MPPKPSLPDSIVMPRRWNRIAAAGLVILLAAVVVCERATGPPVLLDDDARYHDRSFRVSRVVDGDTLDIEAPDRDRSVTRIRLWGVDTPEVAHSGRPDMHFGPEASAFARRTLENRTVHVVLVPQRTRGKYGRLLAYVFLDRGGRMFNEMLLEDGYAYADLRFKHPYFKQFKAIEKRARKSGIGLWKNVTLEQMPQWKQRFERPRTESGG